jgi:ketosteroid isomerase-like protein
MVDLVALPADVFREQAARLTSREWDRAAELYAEDVEIINPFAPERPTMNTGQDAVRAFFTGLGGRVDAVSITDATLTSGADPEVLVAEFSFSMTAGGGSVAYSLPAVFVMRVRNGQIVSSRDYIGPRRSTEAVVI